MKIIGTEMCDFSRKKYSDAPRLGGTWFRCERPLISDAIVIILSPSGATATGARTTFNQAANIDLAGEARSAPWAEPWKASGAHRAGPLPRVQGGGGVGGGRQNQAANRYLLRDPLTKPLLVSRCYYHLGGFFFSTELAAG